MIKFFFTFLVLKLNVEYIVARVVMKSTLNSINSYSSYIGCGMGLPMQLGYHNLYIGI